MICSAGFNEQLGEISRLFQGQQILKPPADDLEMRGRGPTQIDKSVASKLHPVFNLIDHRNCRRAMIKHRDEKIAGRHSLLGSTVRRPVSEVKCEGFRLFHRHS